MSVISRYMKISEIKEILNIHGIETGYGWQIMLWLLFNTYKTDEIEIDGYGRNATFRAKEVTI